MERGDGVTNEREVGLPPLSAARRSTWDYYRIEFLPDGYPGRRMGADLHPHPLYGPYVISDYVAAFKRTRDDRYLEGAHRVALAALERMTERGGALIFEYAPGTVSSLPMAFYSGLTQSRYLASLGELDAVTADRRYHAAQEAILGSFDLPTERGGIARTTPGGGLLLEEYAHAIPDYTLNGWTTTTQLLHRYARASGNEHALDVFRRSVAGIVDVLPLYDVPELANSRYRLAGRARLTLTFSRAGALIESASVDIPGQGTFEVATASTSHWDSRFRSGRRADGVVEGDRVVLDALLSRVSWPVPNRLRMRVRALEATTLTVAIGEGPYDPRLHVLDPTHDVDLERVDLAEGLQEVDVAVPWVRAELVAYPTNFGKRMAGKQFNSYHFIHIDTVSGLAAITGDPLLAYYGARWSEYPSRWPTMAPYAGAGLELERYRPSAVATPAPSSSPA